VSLRVSVLGSGSNGNATFVATSRVRILVDAGFSFRQITKRLQSIGEDPKDLDAVVVTHEHSDHCRGLQTLIKRLGAPIYLTERTAGAVDWGELMSGDGPRPRLETFHAGARLEIGDLAVETFTIPHDAVDPIGLNLRTNGTKASLVTDLGYMTASVKHHIQGADFLLLESNHDLEMLRVGPYPWFVKQRVASRVGHLSNDAVAEFLAGHEFDRRARVLLLGHLSGNNNEPAMARWAAEKALAAAGVRGLAPQVASQDAPSEVYEL